MPSSLDSHLPSLESGAFWRKTKPKKEEVPKKES
jgi:hypothetical protein